MQRATLLLLAIVIVPVPCAGHAVVDVGVHFAAPEFVARGSTASIEVVVDALAYDSAYGVTLQIQINDARASSGDPIWRCISGPELIQCSAEELTAGPHPVRVDVKVPASASEFRARATVDSLGSFDPNGANNSATVESRTFDPARCQQAPPQIAGDFEWTASPGAITYEIFYGIDGETPHVAGKTSDTRAPLNVPGGEVTWFVRARFDGCPALDSARSSFPSFGAPMKLAVVTSWRDGLMAPQSVAIYRSGIVVADPPSRRLYTFDPAGPALAPLRLFGDVVSDPPAFDGGITTGPGDYLYDADRSTHSVRLADSTQYMYFVAGQARAGGTVDGQGLMARFDAPAAIAVDAKGSFFITDSVSHVVRRMAYSSAKFDFTVTTYAGLAGSSGFADGGGSAARFNDPAGVAMDAAGNVLVADRGNHVIRRIAADGTVSTIAGAAGVAGHRDGVGASALFNRPYGVALDPWGNLYVTEEGNHDVRKIAPNRRVTTVAGDPQTPGRSDGVGAAAHFEHPALLAIASDGTLWIPDAGNGRLLRAAPSTGERRRAVRR
jgi:DNA-binding beta-propeller fold protein YncE